MMEHLYPQNTNTEPKEGKIDIIKLNLTQKATESSGIERKNLIYGV